MLKLDRKDLNILSELDMDARQSLSSIARRVGLSKETVNYRIRQMQERGVIEGFYAIIDVSRIGFTIHRIVVRFQRMSPEKEAEIIDYLKNSKSVGWIASLHGNWDMAILFWARNSFEFREVYNELLERYGQYIQKRNLAIITKIRHYRNNYLFGTMDHTEKTIGETQEAKISKTDRKILNILSKDSRTPTTEIAKDTGIVPNTVKNRINYLVRSGVIKGFRAKINTNLLGYRHYKVFLDLENLGERERVMDFLKASPNLVYITEVMGECDLEFEVMFGSDRELNDFLKMLRSECSGLVKDYEIILTYHEHQVNYLPYTS